MDDVRDRVGDGLLEELGEDRVIDVGTARGLKADAIGRAFNGADGIKTSGDGGDAHDVRDAGDSPALEADRRGDALVFPRVLRQGCGEAEVEIGGDILDSEHAAMSSIPRAVMPSTVGVPEHGGGKVSGILQGEPDEFLLWKDDCSPGEILRLFVVEHHEIIEPFARGIAGEVGDPAIGHWHSLEASEPRPLLERAVAALGGVFERGRKNLRESELAGGEASRTVADEIEHGVMAEAHATAESLQQMGLVKVGLAGVGFDNLGDLARPDPCLQRGGQTSGFVRYHTPLAVGGLAMRRMRFASPRRPVSKRCTEKISPQFTQQRNELGGLGFVAPRSGGERLDGLTSGSELDGAELSASGSDIEGDVHLVVGKGQVAKSIVEKFSAAGIKSWKSMLMLYDEVEIRLFAEDYVLFVCGRLLATLAPRLSHGQQKKNRSEIAVLN